MKVKGRLKPAMASTSSSSNLIAAELLSNITKYGYKKMVPYINEHDAVGLDTFKTFKLSQYFAVDTSHAYKNGTQVTCLNYSDPSVDMKLSRFVKYYLNTLQET